MMQTMQYRLGGGLPAMTSHQSSSASGSDADRPPCHLPAPAPARVPLKTFLPRPASSSEFEPAVRVKQEPMEEEEEEEEEEDRGMVIDLTPRGPIPLGSGVEFVKVTGTGGRFPDANRFHPYSHSTQDPTHAFPGTHRKHNREETRRYTEGNMSSDSDSSSETNSNCSSIKSGSCSSGSNGDSGNMLTGTFRFSIPKTSLGDIGSTQSRARREFVPECKKDASYWNKRLKNNDSARRSHIKRKTMEKLMEHRMVELQQENMELRYELNALKRMFGEHLGPDYHASFPEVTSPSSSSTSLPGVGLKKASSSSSSSTHSTSSSPLGGSDEDVKRASVDDRTPPSHPHSRKTLSRGVNSGLDLSSKILTSQPLHHYTRSGSLSSLMSDASSGATSAMPVSESCTEASHCSSSSPQGSPGSLSGPQTSEEEGGSAGSGSVEMRGSGADEESLQKIPWKCRMKRGLHSLYAANRNSAATREDAK